MTVAAPTYEADIEAAIRALDADALRRQYWDQNEFLFIPQFLSRALVEDVFVPQAQAVKGELNRNYIPGHKKGGSVSYYQVAQRAPRFLELYRSDAFRQFLERLTSVRLDLCPENDPHACALYYYTEAGDHIGFHYDTSYYKGARYTILMGLVDRSTRCRLVAHVNKDVPGKTVQELELATAPGDLVIFNGDKLWHAVTPIDAGEERIVLTMEYVTDRAMTPFNRLYSNLKDAFGYFGIRALLGRPKPGTA
ncbi:MAG: 2OG-Fe(II) oxygenase [Nitrospiraceae bacterium]